MCRSRLSTHHRLPLRPRTSPQLHTSHCGDSPKPNFHPEKHLLTSAITGRGGNTSWVVLIKSSLLIWSLNTPYIPALNSERSITPSWFVSSSSKVGTTPDFVCTHDSNHGTSITAALNIAALQQHYDKIMRSKHCITILTHYDSITALW